MRSWAFFSFLFAHARKKRSLCSPSFVCSFPLPCCQFKGRSTPECMNSYWEGRQTTRCCGKNLCGPTLTGSSQRSWLKGDEPLLGPSRSPSHGSKFSVFFLWDSMRDGASSFKSSQHTSPSFAKRYGGLWPWALEASWPGPEYSGYPTGEWLTSPVVRTECWRPQGTSRSLSSTQV